MTVDCFKFVADDPSTNSLFGYSVALDGGTAIVGQANGNKVHIFVRSGGVWLQQAELTHAASGFGRRAVAIHGNTAVVSAEGAAHVFTRSGVSWSPQAILTASDGESNDEFANSLAIDEHTVVVGSPANFTGGAYVFVRSGTTWEQQAKLKASDGHPTNSFGISVAVQGDIAMIGAKDDDQDGTVAGAVYAFVRSGVEWREHQKLVPDAPARGEHFGVGVALSGSTVVVGADHASENGINSGASYVFVLGGSGWE